MKFMTKEGKTSVHLTDHKLAWIKPSTNPFGYGCGNCGAYYQVEYIVTKEKEMFLRFVLDAEETMRLQNFIRETEDTLYLRGRHK